MPKEIVNVTLVLYPNLNQNNSLVNLFLFRRPATCLRMLAMNRCQHTMVQEAITFFTVLNDFIFEEMELLMALDCIFVYYSRKIVRPTTQAKGTESSGLFRA